MDRQQVREELVKGEMIIFESWEFTSDSQGTYFGRLLSGAQDAPDARASRVDFVNNKLADIKISEDVVQ